jgi:membrane-associated phospholipid phosphatase
MGPIAVIVGMTLLDYHWWSDFLAGLCIGIVLLPLTLAPWWATLATRLDRRWPGHQPVSDPPLVTTPRQ